MTSRCSVCGTTVAALLFALLFSPPAFAQALDFVREGTGYVATEGDTRFEIKPATPNPAFRWLLIITNEKTGQLQPMDAKDAKEALAIINMLRHRRGTPSVLPQ